MKKKSAGTSAARHEERGNTDKKEKTENSE